MSVKDEINPMSGCLIETVPFAMAKMTMMQIASQT